MYDVAVIGGGIVGLATAQEVLERSPASSVVVLEKEDELAQHQTSHNSGVIHSGLYYRPGSLKARICRTGVEKLTAFCDAEGIPYERSGKVVVAADESERSRLHSLLRRGEENGLRGLELVSRDRLKEIEPHADGVEALVVPETGVVSFRVVAEKLAELVRKGDGEIRTRSRVLGLENRTASSVVRTVAGDYEAKRVVCCAGLYADRLARLSGLAPSILVVPFRGEYYRLRPERRSLVRSLIYPVPDPRFPFLGVHFTRRIDGDVEAGPNAVLALAREGYRRRDVNWVDLAEMLRFRGFWLLGARHVSTAVREQYRSWSKRAFVRALSRLVPDVEEGDLEPGGSGVRAMALDGRGKLLDDFRVERSGRVIHVLNAPSPAATAALAIAQYVVDLLE